MTLSPDRVRWTYLAIILACIVAASVLWVHARNTQQMTADQINAARVQICTNVRTVRSFLATSAAVKQQQAIATRAALALGNPALIPPRLRPAARTYHQAELAAGEKEQDASVYWKLLADNLIQESCSTLKVYVPPIPEGLRGQR